MEEFPSLYLWHNPSWTAEALENILENAVKYSPPGSRIMICIKSYEMYSELQISDQGPGIDKTEETEIFKRFLQEPQGIRGRGLRHWSLSCETDPGKGKGICDCKFKAGMRKYLQCILTEL